MSVIAHRDAAELSDRGKPSATSSDLAFARQAESRQRWQRTRALVRRAWGPLIVYAILGAALVAAIAIRVAVWVPQLWH